MGPDDGGGGRRPTIVVVGAGIAGLAAAWEATDAGADVVLLEADRRAGGKLASTSLLGRRIDTGADAFLARRPEATAFVRDVGLGAALISPEATSALVWSGGRLQRLPEGLLLGLPSNLAAVARSGVLSPFGLARAGLDLVLPGEPVPAGADIAVGPLVRRRLGAEVHERLVDPLLGGINAGNSDDLSLQAGVPQLAGAVQGHRSLLVAAWLGRRRQQRAQGSGPVFCSVQGGLGHFADQMALTLAGRGVKVVLGFTADRLDRREADHGPGAGRRGAAWSVVTSTGARFAADAVVLAVPAGSAASLLWPHAPSSAALLGDIRTASVAMVCLAYRKEDVGRALDGSGFLVPRREGRLMTACSWASSKWPDVAAPGMAVLRVSAGRAGDSRALALSDDLLVARLHIELVAALGITGDPAARHVTRWVDAFPQYAPGHAEVVAAIDHGLPAGLEVAGATYRGVGVPACIGSGRAAARRAVATARISPG